MVGWGGCECHGLMSNTLSLSMSVTQPIPQWSATVQCVSKPLCCCHFNQCVGAAVLSHFFIHKQKCGLLPEYQLAACQPHSLKRERWGLSRYGLMPGRV